MAEEVFDLEEALEQRKARKSAHAAVVDPLSRREEDIYGDGTVSARNRPAGAGTTAIPKKVG